MGIFKKEKAVHFEKMNRLSEVTITGDKLRFTLNYSAIDVPAEDVPKLVADFIQIYAILKPELDRKSQEKIDQAKEHNKVNEDSKIDEEIDLSNIPF